MRYFSGDELKNGRVVKQGRWVDREPCWSVRRESPTTWQSADSYFRETIIGAHCDSNWYEGNGGTLGEPQNHLPSDFTTEDAPALLGFDESIDQYCATKLHEAHPNMRPVFGHAANCVHANQNILSLYGDRVPYNICRNFEWMVCAAQGRLPGQGFERRIVFAKEPGDLYPGGGKGKPLGDCCGWAPPSKPTGGFGYTTDDIFYLEVCLFNEICNNGDALFHLKVGEDFVCDFSRQRFAALKALLLSPAQMSTEAVQCDRARTCNAK